MKIMKKDIRANDQITTFFALESIRLKTSRNKNNYVELSFHDRTGKIKGYLWNDPVVASAVLKEKTIVKVQANVSLYNDSLILNVDKIRQAAKKDLLLAGAFLHDIGKTRELFWDIGREYTTEGRLMGHIAIGIMMIEEKLASMPDFPKDLAILLRHMVLSHHGSLAFGSPVRPATPEALVLSLLDNTDAKINHVYGQMAAVKPDEIWSGFDKVLETSLYQRKYERIQMNQQEVAS